MLLRLWSNIILIFVITNVNCQSETQNNNNPTRFRVIYEWNFINFTWPSEDVIRTSIATGRYIPQNVHISGVKYFDNYLYLTVPRMKEGVPATLTRIPYNSKDETAPLLEPYPSWDMNTEGDCSALQNVQNVEIDTKGMLYILDGGRTGTFTKNPRNECQPRLVIYDIKSNKTVTSYTFPQEITNNGSFLYDLVVDEVDGGYLYITDNSGIDPALIVYSIKQGRSWIIRDDNTMKARPEAVDFLVNGTAVSAAINIAGIALGPPSSIIQNDHEIISQDRMVYYCPLSSYRLYSINSAILRDERSATTGISNYVTDLGRKASQTDGIVMDEFGVLYYGLLADSSIARWDSKTPFTSGQKVIARDRTFIQWPDSLAFDTSGNLLLVTNRLQKFIYGQLDLKQPNFRILQGHVGARSYLYSSHENHEANTYRSSSEMMMNSGSSTSTMTPTTQNISKNDGNSYYAIHNTETSSESHSVEMQNSANSLLLQINTSIFVVAILLMFTFK